jgi:hypothetical protein
VYDYSFEKSFAVGFIAAEFIVIGLITDGFS